MTTIRELYIISGKFYLSPLMFSSPIGRGPMDLSHDPHIASAQFSNIPIISPPTRSRSPGRGTTKPLSSTPFPAPPIGTTIVNPYALLVDVDCKWITPLGLQLCGQIFTTTIANFTAVGNFSVVVENYAAMVTTKSNLASQQHR
jgi:hypothetical protein